MEEGRMPKRLAFLVSLPVLHIHAARDVLDFTEHTSDAGLGLRQLGGNGALMALR
jgi:hypothetical protein